MRRQDTVIKNHEKQQKTETDPKETQTMKHSFRNKLY